MDVLERDDVLRPVVVLLVGGGGGAVFFCSPSLYRNVPESILRGFGGGDAAVDILRKLEGLAGFSGGCFPFGFNSSRSFECDARRLVGGGVSSPKSIRSSAGGFEIDLGRSGSLGAGASGFCLSELTGEFVLELWKKSLRLFSLLLVTSLM